MEKTKISAKIVADSKDKNGNRITTMIVTFPRIILAELNTHRMFSRNSASSRAIPFKKMVESVVNDPFIPLAWQKDHSGMQGTEYFTDVNDIRLRTENWLNAKDEAIRIAEKLNRQAVTKQFCNRLLEPFMWHTVLITATEFFNFFELRSPQYQLETSYGPKKYRSKKDLLSNIGLPDLRENYKEWTEVDWLRINKGQAEIHMMALAETMWDAMNESTPKELQSGEWHIPFSDNIEDDLISEYLHSDGDGPFGQPDYDIVKAQIATARCARVSYTVVGDEKKSSAAWQEMYSKLTILDPDGWDRQNYEQSWNELITLEEYKRRVNLSTCMFHSSDGDNQRTYFDLIVNNDYKKDIELHDRLLQSGHFSPFEHCAKAMTDEEFVSYCKGIHNNTDQIKTDQGGLRQNQTLINNFIINREEQYGWCLNYRGFIQYREMVSVK